MGRECGFLIDISNIALLPGEYSPNICRINKRIVSGDFNGDGKTDIAAVYDYGNLKVRTHVWLSTGSKFKNEEHWFVSGTGNYIASKVTKVTTGDFNGDGKADVAAIYSYGKPKKSIHLWKSTGKTLSKMEIW